MQRPHRARNSIQKVRSSANLQTISPIDDEKDQSFQDSFKRLRSLLIGQRARFACLETIVDAGALENALERGSRDRSHQDSGPTRRTRRRRPWRSARLSERGEGVVPSLALAYRPRGGGLVASLALA